MILENALFTALLMGFFGSTHCVAMCGGIVGMLSQGDSNTDLINTSKITVAYNLGRITSYSFIGLLAGTIGMLAFKSVDSSSLYTFSRIFTGVFMLAFGFYLLGWWNFLTFLEKKGQYLWKKISPLTKRLLPIRSGFHAFLVGILWGWLPCGLVYSAVAWSLSMSSPLNGALLMLFFGLGTLPMLLAMGIASQKLAQIKGSVLVRNISGGIIIVFAIMQLLSINPFMDHSAHTNHSDQSDQSSQSEPNSHMHMGH